MSTYAQIADMVARFGNEEMVQLTDRANVQTNTINNALLQAKMDDAEAELNVMLACCYDVKNVIAPIYTAGGFVPVLKHWLCDITRKHLYDQLENAEHEVLREYEDFKKEIMEICKCQILLDNNLNEIAKKGFANNYLIDEPGCYPTRCGCCFTDPCNCARLGSL